MPDPAAWPWVAVTAAAPDLAAAVAARFAAHPHHVLATLHADGRPRVNGTNVFVTDGRLWVGAMPGARRVVDLDERSWCALHSAPLDESLPTGGGDARIEARAVRLDADAAQRVLAVVHPDGDPPPGGDVFELWVASMSLLEVDGEELVLRRWSSDGGEQSIRRS